MERKEKPNYPTLENGLNTLKQLDTFEYELYII